MYITGGKTVAKGYFGPESILPVLQTSNLPSFGFLFSLKNIKETLMLFFDSFFDAPSLSST